MCLCFGCEKIETDGKISTDLSMRGKQQSPQPNLCQLNWICYLFPSKADTSKHLLQTFAAFTTKSNNDNDNSNNDNDNNNDNSSEQQRQNEEQQKQH